MEFNGKDFGKLESAVHHFKKLDDSLEVLFGLFDSGDQRLHNLATLRKQITYFDEKITEHKEAKEAAKAEEKRNLNVGSIRLLLALQTFYPKAFPVELEKIVPLRIGIQYDIAHAIGEGKLAVPGIQVTGAMIAEVLRTWTRTAHYYYSFKDNRYRYDLNGDPIEYVLPRDFNFANKKFVEMQNQSNYNSTEEFLNNIS